MALWRSTIYGECSIALNYFRVKSGWTLADVYIVTVLNLLESGYGVTKRSELLGSCEILYGM
jgi:hypothetical protein